MEQNLRADGDLRADCQMEQISEQTGRKRSATQEPPRGQRQRTGPGPASSQSQALAAAGMASNEAERAQWEAQGWTSYTAAEWEAYIWEREQRTLQQNRNAQVMQMQASTLYGPYKGTYRAPQ